MLDSVENPAASVPKSRSVDLETALDPNKPAEERCQAMERVLLQREEALRAEVSMLRLKAASTVDGSAVVRAAFAYLTEAPLNWHQVTVYYAGSDSPEDAPMKGRLPLLFAGSAAMSLAQSVAVVAVYQGTYAPACTNSNQCYAGAWCQVGMRPHCVYCGDVVPMPMQLADSCAPTEISVASKTGSTGSGCQTWNYPPDPNFSGWNSSLVSSVCAVVPGTGLPAARDDGTPAGGGAAAFPADTVASWCERCVHAIDMTVDSTTPLGLIDDNVGAMGVFEFVTLAFCCFIVSSTIVGEVRVSFNSLG